MDAMVKVAKDHPDVYFEHATGYKTTENLRVYEARFYEGAYLAGVVAGKTTNEHARLRRFVPHPRGAPEHQRVHARRAERQRR